MEDVGLHVLVQDVDGQPHCPQAVGFLSSTKLELLVGLLVGEGGLDHLSVLLLYDLEVLHPHDGAGAAGVNQHEELVELLADGDGVPPLLSTVSPEEHRLGCRLSRKLLRISVVVMEKREGVSTGLNNSTGCYLYLGSSHPRLCLHPWWCCMLVGDWTEGSSFLESFSFL